MDKVNPESHILMGAMILNYTGWNGAADLIEKAIQKIIKSKVVTYDFA